MHQNIVPILHAGLDAGHAHSVRQQSRQPLAGILSGFVGIQTEEHTLHVRTFRKKLLQCLCRHPPPATDNCAAASFSGTAQ